MQLKWAHALVRPTRRQVGRRECWTRDLQLKWVHALVRATRWQVGRWTCWTRDLQLKMGSHTRPPHSSVSRAAVVLDPRSAVEHGLTHSSAPLVSKSGGGSFGPVVCSCIWAHALVRPTRQQFGRRELRTRDSQLKMGSLTRPFHSSASRAAGVLDLCFAVENGLTHSSAPRVSK